MLEQFGKGKKALPVVKTLRQHFGRQNLGDDGHQGNRPQKRATRLRGGVGLNIRAKLPTVAREWNSARQSKSRLRWRRRVQDARNAAG
jgi:hypothetical protein